MRSFIGHVTWLAQALGCMPPPPPLSKAIHARASMPTGSRSELRSLSPLQAVVNPS
jgi:hypothetical protein